MTIYGSDYQGNEVQIQGQLGALSLPKKPIPWSIPLFGLYRSMACAPSRIWPGPCALRRRNSSDSISGLHFKLPEILGQTRSGYCGNPMTSLAHFYLGQELSHLLNEGQTLPVALERARSRTLSRLTQELDLGAEPEYLTLRGLKIGMRHDDSEVVQGTLRRVLSAFPLDPWS